MAAAGVTPNAMTYSTLVNCCGRAGEVERAFAVLDQMQDAGPAGLRWALTSLVHHQRR